jgi:hypothetical protein
MEIIERWDFMGWQETMQPDVGVQLTWNRTLATKIMFIVNKIFANSRTYPGDTITIHPAIEGLLHPDFYDNHRKTLMNRINVTFDDTMEKNFIEVKCLKMLENLNVMPEISSEGNTETITIKTIDNFSEEQIKEYMSGLIGYIIIDNLNAV